MHGALPASERRIPLALSQGHLALWQTCPRKFQLAIANRLSAPPPVERQERMQAGSRFHLLLQQRELGLDVMALADSDPQLRAWMHRFEAHPPTILTGKRYSEHGRTFAMTVDAQPYLLTVVYDLLAIDTAAAAAQILDWKTYQRAVPWETLRENWQTRLYLFVLAETTGIAPTSLAMTYWFANTGESVAIAYDAEAHAKTYRDLVEVMRGMAQAALQGVYPQLPQGSPVCDRCEFAYRCERNAGQASSGGLAIATLADIPETIV